MAAAAIVARPLTGSRYFGTWAGGARVYLGTSRLDPDLSLVERCLSGDDAAW